MKLISKKATLVLSALIIAGVFIYSFLQMNKKNYHILFISSSNSDIKTSISRGLDIFNLQIPKEIRNNVSLKFIHNDSLQKLNTDQSIFSNIDCVISLADYETLNLILRKAEIYQFKVISNLYLSKLAIPAEVDYKYCSSAIEHIEKISALKPALKHLNQPRLAILVQDTHPFNYSEKRYYQILEEFEPTIIYIKSLPEAALAFEQLVEFSPDIVILSVNKDVSEFFVRTAGYEDLPIKFIVLEPYRYENLIQSFGIFNQKVLQFIETVNTSSLSSDNHIHMSLNSSDPYSILVWQVFECLMLSINQDSVQEPRTLFSLHQTGKDQISILFGPYTISR